MALDRYTIELPNGMESVVWGIPGRDTDTPEYLLGRWAECWSYGNNKVLNCEVIMRGPGGLVLRAHVKTKRDWVAKVSPINQG